MMNGSLYRRGIGMGLRRWFTTETVANVRAGGAFVGIDMLTDRRRQVLVKKNAADYLDSVGAYMFHDGEYPEWFVPSKTVPVPMEAFEKDVLQNKAIDYVLVGSSLEDRPKHVIQCLEAGKHVLCEFPLSLDSKEVEKVLAKSLQSKQLLFIANSKFSDEDMIMGRERFREAPGSVDTMRILSKEPRRYPEHIEMGSDAQLKLTLDYMLTDFDYIFKTVSPIREIEVEQVCMGDLGVDVTLRVYCEGHSHPSVDFLTCKFSYRLDFLGYVNKVLWNDVPVLRAEAHTWNLAPWVDAFWSGTVNETERFKNIVLALKDNNQDQDIQSQIKEINDDNQLSQLLTTVISKIMEHPTRSPLPPPPPPTDLSFLDPK